MNDDREQQPLKDYLKSRVKPVDTELSRDLWPQMLRRLDERVALPIPWLDWALLGLLGALLLTVPEAIPIFLYQF